jgi:DNA polymerase-4
MHRKIIHIDMDAFYASVEQRDNPDLLGKPLAVGYAAKRGVVAAASYEARKFGVHSAMASVVARRKCPEIIFVPPRFEVYRQVSSQIRKIFEEYTSFIEPLSLDEAYLDVTQNFKGIETATAIAKKIREQILETTNLTASAGISYNKFLAKLASDQRKPNGQFVITPDKGMEFIEKLEINAFHGIGPVTAKKMNQLGIFTGLDLRNQSLEFLAQHFSKTGQWYYDIARAEDNRPVESNRIRKSYSSESTFDEDLTELPEIEKKILSIADDVWLWSDKTDQRGHTITIKIKFADFKQSTKSKSFLMPVRESEAFYNTVTELIYSAYPLRTGIRLLGVTLANFELKNKQQPTQLNLDF